MVFEYPEDMAAFGQAVVKAGEKKSFIQVSASWCGPCQQIKDEMAQLSEELKDSYVFIYVDTDKCEEIQELYEVTSMPTFIILTGPGPAKARYEGGQFPSIKAFAEDNKDLK